MLLRTRWVLLLAAFSAFQVVASTPDHVLEAAPAQIAGQEQWLVNGGVFKIRLNQELLDAKGIRYSGFEPEAGQPFEDEAFAVYPLLPKEGLQFNAPEGGFDRFSGGSLGIQGGFSFRLPSGEKLTMRQARLAFDHEQPMRLQLIGDDGQAWMYLNHLMYKMMEDYTVFYVRSADLRMSAALAHRIGRPELADQYIGEVKMQVRVAAQPFGFVPPDAKAILACPDFPGSTNGAGEKYFADVVMESYSMSTSRCRNSTQSGACDGPAGADDGDVVFTPSSTLRNSNHPLGADVPWYQKFMVSPYSYPYVGNDQHPYLIWNMYRISDNQLEQIGASGVKHAFLTVNTGCSAGACTGNGHVLGKGCGDTYGTSNNDSNNDLGPRSELIPAKGEWARCRSIYDTNCDGTSNITPNGSYDQRMVVKESKLPSAGSPPATYFSESWYIVKDDINIYNTMAHRTMAPAGTPGSWSPGAQGAFILGPAINSWVNPVTYPTRNVEIASDEGHSRIAVQAQALASCPVASGFSGTCYRYDYVVNNFDFARVTYSPPPNHVGPNLGIDSNHGFNAFRLELGSSVPVWIDPAAHFADIDSNAANNWAATTTAESVTWTAPPSNELRWGTLYRFSFVTTAIPNPDFVRSAALSVGGDSNGFEFSKLIMTPNVGTLLSNGFE